MINAVPAVCTLRYLIHMNPTIETLTALQELTNRASVPVTHAQQVAMSQLRAKLTLPVLVYFDRHVTRGRKAVAPVRNGVCLSCHLRVPVGTVASLVSSSNLVTCENCGVYLTLAPDEGAFLPEASGASRVTVRRTTKRKAPAKPVMGWTNESPELLTASIPALVST